MQNDAAMPRLTSLIWIALAAGCGGPGFRHEIVGSGRAGGAVPLPAAGEHRVDWTIATPRAMRVAWTIACGDAAPVAGVAGETFEAYRERRLAELRARQERKKDTIAAIGGAVLGSATAATRVETPTGEAQATATVDGHAVGAVVAEGVISDDVQLPPGDVGAQVLEGEVSIVATSPGVCTMTVAPEDAAADAAGLRGDFRVVRIVDVAGERAAIAAERRQHAVVVRGALQASLIARGADPELRARIAAEREAEARARAAIDAEARARREAEARARIEAEARVRAEAEARARAEAEARVRAEAELRLRISVAATATRQHVLAYLVGVCGADPDAYARRQRARADEERRIADARARRDAELQARLDAEARVRAEHDAARQRRLAAALDARAEVTAYLRWLGAIEKPPMPAPLDEDRGPPPLDGAVWIAGEWVWRGGAWVWITGGWTIPDSGFSRDDAVDNTITVSIDADAGAEVGGGTTHVVTHPDRDDDEPRRDRPKTRDHRDDDEDEPKPRVKTRDHRR